MTRRSVIDRLVERITSDDGWRCWFDDSIRSTESKLGYCFAVVASLCCQATRFLTDCRFTQWFEGSTDRKQKVNNSQAFAGKTVDEEQRGKQSWVSGRWETLRASADEERTE
ncbi:uncharacterized protein PADG_02240 [Paracoccidioides brasiliensis Pb18]|uniref:Uncharacterized protein n=1 Tax=Paracoccidioides brasiliensis (strain Pb18) TaxID=502780 RepID=C1G274_PARBD|nr:uncharacterized protein PADG_02240 [Paracoccidioides brasiliensis Pb18]EEH46090.2 hypothetical protein PADG_02240 [Paracoccidioides brasiliensis Pb18]